MKLGLICSLITIFVASAGLAGFIYGQVAKVNYQPIEAHINSCVRNESRCGEMICVQITLNVTLNVTVEGRTFTETHKFDYQLEDNSLTCPRSETITVWRDKSEQFADEPEYCIEEYASRCARSLGYIAGIVVSAIILAGGIVTLGYTVIRIYV